MSFSCIQYTYMIRMVLLLKRIVCFDATISNIRLTVCDSISVVILIYIWFAWSYYLNIFFGLTIRAIRSVTSVNLAFVNRVERTLLMICWEVKKEECSLFSIQYSVFSNTIQCLEECLEERVKKYQFLLLAKIINVLLIEKSKE